MRKRLAADERRATQMKKHSGFIGGLKWVCRGSPLLCRGEYEAAPRLSPDLRHLGCDRGYATAGLA